MDATSDVTDNREVKFTYEELLAQNRSLTEELSQCRADKDFVWTLWKRLQADKPDVSSAVSMVITREQEKAEEKDKKVLVILQEKDNNIKILEEIAADLEVQLKQSMERLSGLLVERTEWEGKIDELKKTVDKLNEEKTYQQEVMKARESESEKDKSNYESKIENLEKIKQEFESRIGDLEGEVDKLSKEKSTIATLMETNTVLRDKIKVLEKDLDVTKHEHEEKINALRSRERQLLAESLAANEQIENIEQKDTEIASLSVELKKRKLEHDECLDHIREQNAIIKNLQLLQDETQHVLRNQQESHKSEVRSYKNTLNELRMKCLSLQSTNEKLYGDTEALRQSLSFRQRENTDKDIEIADLRQSLTQRHHGFDSETQTVDLDCSRCRDLGEQLEDAKDELENMKDVVQNKGRRISSLEKALNEKRKRNFTFKEQKSDFDSDHFDESDVRAGLKSRIDVLEKEIEDLDVLLTLKDNELQQTKKAHSRRLQRYKMLRENYAMVNKQLRTFEQETPKAINEMSLRADAKSLQHENSDSVWNELSFYRKQYEILKKEREDFEEEVDSLRVDNAEMKAMLKELKIDLHRQENDCLRLKNEILSKEKFVSPSQLYSAEAQVEIWRKKAKQLELQNETLTTENEALSQRERYYKKEIVNLSNEIDHIHKNIKEKIDAEVQASEAIETFEKQANKSLDRIANSIADRKRELIEQYIQTSPLSPYKRRSPKRPISQSTQSTQTIETQSHSEDESFSSQKSTQSPYKHGKHPERGNDINALLLDDLRMPKRKRTKNDKKLSPVKMGKIEKKKRLPPKSSPAAREQTSLKVRILSLQQQVDVLRNAKSRLNMELQEQKDVNEVIKGELDAATRKLDMNKLAIQRFSDELQRCNRDRDDFEQELERERKRSKPPEIGYKEMENRWKLATTECSKLSFQVKTLRGENNMMTAKQKEFQDRIVWLERQFNQKKLLLEDLREKLKEATQATAKEKESLEEIKKRNKALSMNEEQKKQFIEDLRNKINQISVEKLGLKQQLQDCQEELKRKSRLLQQSQDLCNHAEKAVSEMEKAAFEQLHEQATEQEKLHGKLKDDLSKQQKRVVEHQWVIKNFVEAILKGAHRSRVLIFERRRQKREEEKKRLRRQESMKEARDIASSILNMTSEDIEAFMEDEAETETLSNAGDDDIREKVKALLSSSGAFSKVLLKLLLELIDQNWKLRMQEQVELNSHAKLLNQR